MRWDHFVPSVGNAFCQQVKCTRSQTAASMEQQKQPKKQGGGGAGSGRPELPQWNSKFSFSAQKKPAAAATGTSGGAAAGGGSSAVAAQAAAPASAQKKPTQQQPQRAGGAGSIRRTPGLCGPRRVPVAAGKAGGAGGASKQAAPAAATTPLGDDSRTPTACLFARFESLTLSTPATRALGSSQPTQAAGGAAPPSAGASTATAATATRQRSVAFGTPCVLPYTPSGAGAAATPEGTPLWSNAGHTPYSLASTGGSSGVRGILGFESEATSRHSIGSGGGRSAAPVELLTSVITHTDDGQQTPAPTVGRPITPAAGAAAATPDDDGAAAAAAGALQLAAAGEQDAGGEQRESDAAPRSPAVPAASTGARSGAAAKVAAATPDASAATPLSARVAPQPAATPKPAATPAVTPKPAAGTPALRRLATPLPHSAVPLELLLSGAASAGLPQPTPQSRLRQPQRVAQAGKARPVVPAELRMLLDDPDAAAAAAAAAADACPAVCAGGVGTSDAAAPALLGSCDVLSPVRPRKQLAQALGAGDQVLTPVRRSARKAAAGKDAALLHNQHQGGLPLLPPGRVAPMLEATHYCYQPNDALLPPGGPE